MPEPMPITTTAEAVTSLQTRLILTLDGWSRARVAERFANKLIDMHWVAIVRSLDDPSLRDLREFAGITVDGHKFLADPDRLPAFFPRADCGGS